MRGRLRIRTETPATRPLGCVVPPLGSTAAVLFQPSPYSGRLRTMTQRLTALSLAAAILTGAAFLFVSTGCQPVTAAPKGSPRLELEVGVEVEAGFANHFETDAAEIAGLLRELAAAHGDVALRFYPVLADQYGEGDPRPAMRMTLTARDVDVRLERHVVVEQNAEPDAASVYETVANRVDCEVAAQLERRRDSGPALTVARATGRGRAEVDADGDGAVTWSYRGTDAVGAALAVPVQRGSVARALRSAIQRAFGEMLPAIDRELAQNDAAAATGG